MACYNWSFQGSAVALFTALTLTDLFSVVCLSPFGACVYFLVSICWPFVRKYTVINGSEHVCILILTLK